MGLWDSMKGVFGREKDSDDNDSESAYEQYEEDLEREPKAEDFREKAEERDRTQEEFEEAMREAKEEQARQEETPPIQPVATEAAEEKPEPKPKTASELRRERIEELRQKGQISELESRYTRTGQLKTRLKGAAKETFLGKKRVTDKDEKTGAARRATKVIRNVATLGGAVSISKARKGYYVPKMDKSLYGTSGMRELTTPSPGRPMQAGTLRRAGTPSYEHLRQTTTFRPQQTAPFQPRRTQPTTASPVAKMSARTPTHLAKPMGFIKVGSQAQDVATERLRGLTFPTGLTSSEKLAYAEIKANHDIDTKSHVVSELMDLGIDKMEALRAVEGLMQRRIVKRGQSFAGESTLEIAK